MHFMLRELSLLQDSEIFLRITVKFTILRISPMKSFR